MIVPGGMERFVIDQQRTDEPSRDDAHRALHSPSGELKERGGYPGHVSESSLYTKASLHPLLTTALVFGVGLAVAALCVPASRNRIGERVRQLAA